jgi:hypothetical protein
MKKLLPIPEGKNLTKKARKHKESQTILYSSNEEFSVYSSLEGFELKKVYEDGRSRE